METEHTTQEVSRLRRCINDLASLLALPAMWTRQDHSRVINTLFAVLIRMLDLDFAYARITDPASESPREFMQSADSIDHEARADEVGQSLEPYLTPVVPMANFRIANPIAEGTASIAVLHLGVQHRVAYSSQPHTDLTFRPKSTVFCCRSPRTKPLSQYRKPGGLNNGKPALQSNRRALRRRSRTAKNGFGRWLTRSPKRFG